ncbi:MAG: hypothetical protein JXA89_26225 [Anaerolineae bacterium]|nr:hypothetical protein [Anaerolineae bacterium]
MPRQAILPLNARGVNSTHLRVGEQCSWLVTFNGRRLQPGHPAVTVVRPRQSILCVRDALAHLASEE